MTGLSRFSDWFKGRSCGAQLDLENSLENETVWETGRSMRCARVVKIAIQLSGKVES